MGNTRPLLTRLIEFPKVARVRNNHAVSGRWTLSLGMIGVMVLVTACGPAGIDLRDLGQNGSEAGTTLYVVQSGDTLSGIAAAHGTTVDVLIQLNGAAYPKLAESQGRMIVAGWKLAVPAVTAQASPAQPLAAASVTPVTGDAAPAASPEGYIDEAAATEIFRLTNEERTRQGLGALVVDAGLMDIARIRAHAIASNFSHNGIESLCNCGENAARLTARSTAEAFFNGWLASEGHRRNLLRPDYKSIGVAVYRIEATGMAYAIQVFVW